MNEHIRRGATIETDLNVPGDVLDDGHVMHEHYCTDCDSAIRLRAREGEHAYVRLGCDCGAVELALRIADIIEGDLERDGIEKWGTKDPSEVYDE